MPAEDPAHFRPDIEGLRAVAILAVLGYHAEVPGFTGGFLGVDVFFVISGFLITGLLVREVGESGRIDFPAFWARRARRLLPAALVVIAGTVIGSALILSPLRTPGVAGDAAAAALYVSNYRFALAETDYFAATDEISPLLHYWSLGVEEQFYLFWPALIAISLRIATARRLWLTVLAVAIGSFALSELVRQVDAPWAFYSLPTRAWQLAIGALVYLGAARMPKSLPRRAASIAGVAGLVMIGAAVYLVDEGTITPGSAGLFPSLGTAIVIVAGSRPGGLVGRLLSTSPPRWFGRISYSLYLCHWPILILGPIALARDDLLIRLTLAVMSVAVASVLTRTVEARFRVSRRASISHPGTLTAAVAASVVVAVGALGWSASSSPAQAGPIAPLPTMPPLSDTRPARLEPLLSGAIPPDVQPPLMSARDDKPRVILDGCYAGPRKDAVAECAYGDTTSPTVAVLFGDSHAAMWFPAVESLALERGWKVVPMIKTACPPVEVTVWNGTLRREFTECDTFREAALARIERLRPAVIFVGSARGHQLPGPGGEPVEAATSPAWRTGFVTVLKRLRETGARVVLFGEPPQHRRDPLECLARRATIDACETDRWNLYDPDYGELEHDVARQADADYVASVDWLCQAKACPLILDGLLVYRDEGHLTATIAARLAPWLRWSYDHRPGAASP